MKHFVLLFLLLVCVGCKSVAPSLSDSSKASVSTHQATLDTVVVRDSVYVQDSTFTSERQHGDTIVRERVVYRDRIEWRDRWRVHVEHDTIVRTDSIVQTIEHPPRRYVPRFHKWCTGLFWVLVLLALVRVAVGRRRR